MSKALLISTQFAFYLDSSIDQPITVWEALKEEFKEIFTQSPIIMPMASNQLELQEIPVIQAISINKIFRLNISIKG